MPAVIFGGWLSVRTFLQRVITWTCVPSAHMISIKYMYIKMRKREPSCLVHVFNDMGSG